MGRLLGRRLASVVGLAWAMAAGGWCLPARAANSYGVDPVHSSATFRVQHLGISWVAGRFNDVAGACTIDKADPTGCAFEIVIKTASVDTNNAKRDEDLRSKNYFDAEQFPLMTFKSTSVKKAPPAAESADPDAAYEVTGDFTLHGVTKPLTFILCGGKEAEFPKGAHRVGFFADFTIKRSDYGIAKMLGPIGDQVKIAVSFEATRK